MVIPSKLIAFPTDVSMCFYVVALILWLIEPMCTRVFVLTAKDKNYTIVAAEKNLGGSERCPLFLSVNHQHAQ